MKFSNGCWLNREGTEVFSPVQVYYVKKDEHLLVKEIGQFSCNELIICAPTHKIMDRGDTLGGVNLTIRISSPMAEILRIRTDHYLGVNERTPDFELTMDSDNSLTVDNSDELIIIHSGKLRLEINKNNKCEKIINLFN